MGKFWMDDDFVRVKGRKLSVYAQLLYVCLSSHAKGVAGKTFVGHRLIAEELGINKDTVTKYMKELEVSGFIRRSKRLRGQVSDITLLSVRNEGGEVSDAVRPKEESKEVFKEGETNRHLRELTQGSTKGQRSVVSERLRSELGLIIKS